MRPTHHAVLMTALAFAPVASGSAQAPTGTSPSGTLTGTWAGSLTHDRDTTAFLLAFQPPDDSGRVVVRMWIPVIYLLDVPVARAKPVVDGNAARVGPFSFVYDSVAGTLSGTVPSSFIPVYTVPFTLRRVARAETPPRPPLTAPDATPVWVSHVGGALWAGPTYADGAVYVGGADGHLHALDARSGKTRWDFQAGGAIRTRPTVVGDALYFQADDGFLYRLAATTGEQRWRARVVEGPVERLPFNDPKSRYDRFGSDVTVANGHLYLGTHDGKVLALDTANGDRVWEFPTGNAVLAAPSVSGGVVYAGSFDHHVYALDEATGAQRWQYDTGAPVVSTPALDAGHVVIGSRSFDLFSLDARTGARVWNRFFWFSWVESSATIRNGVAYVGSSDAAGVYAVEPATGRRVWDTDVFGWCWGQPAVTDRRVYVGTSGTAGYPVAHRGAVVALDRTTGHPVWQYVLDTGNAPGAFGFPGSTALGDGMVFASALDGRVYAFAQ
jgi:outer membrane protein assembly factor BamB